MITVTPLSGANAGEYYLDRAAGCEADYYLNPEEAAGRWAGGGADALGLTGALDEPGEEAFRALLAGNHPVTGEQLVHNVMRADPLGRLVPRPLVEAINRVAHERGLRDPSQLFGSERLLDVFLSAGTAARKRPFVRSLEPRLAGELAEAAGLDPVEVFREPETGQDRYGPALERADVKIDVRNSGYDVCVSAPKSVSTLFGMADPDVATKVRTAHDAAVTTALTYLEGAVGHGLRGHQGDGQRSSHMKTDGFIGAAFSHRTSRANDPQLHTHVVIANMLHGADGKWTAVDSWSLFRHSLTASYIYHAALRSELTRELGVAWTPVEKGIAEIAGIPLDLREALSTRSDAIDNVLAEIGRDDTAAKQWACLNTRPAKEHIGEPDLRRRWKETAEALGYDPVRLVAETLGRADTAAVVDQDELTRQLVGTGGLTRQRTTVDRRDVLQALCDGLPAGSPITLKYLSALANDVASSNGVVLLRGGEDDPRLSTTELVDTEQKALRLADVLRHSPTGFHGQVVLRDSLSEEQRQLVMALVGDEGLSVVVGPAGSGKTAALAAAHRGWRAVGIPVHGTAVSAIAARGLQRMTGIPSGTIERLLQDLDRIDPDTQRPSGLAVGSVLVVDEAGMVDTRTLTRLLEHVRTSGARLILCGDTEQLPEINAGGLFKALADQPETLRLTGNVRQANDWERYALADLRAARVGQALLAYLDAGRIHVCETPGDLREEIVSAYFTARETAGPDRVVVLASTRREVRALNSTIRRYLVSTGTLGLDVAAPFGYSKREIAVGDQLLITRNRYRDGLLNGMRGEVVDVDRCDWSVIMRDTDGLDHCLDQDLLNSGDVDYAYAMTVHKAQGMTVDVALVSGTATLRKEASYVALSRGRIANHLFVTEADLHDVAPDVAADHHLDRLNQLQQQLERRSGHRLASSYEPYPTAAPERQIPERGLDR